MLQYLSRGVSLFNQKCGNFQEFLGNFYKIQELKMETLKLTIQEAQELLLLSQSSVYSWIDKGKLQSQETPGGKIIIISRKEAEEIKNFNLKSRRNKYDELSSQNPENSVINPEILEIEAGKSQNDTPQNPAAEGILPANSNTAASSDITLKLISKIEELALEAGRFKQLEILRNEEKENVKFWQEKYHELSAELKKKDYEIIALKAQIEALKAKKENSLLNFFKRN